MAYFPNNVGTRKEIDACTPQRPHNCVPSGVGPDCNWSDNGEKNKAECLAAVNVACEESLAACVEECQMVRERLIEENTATIEGHEQDVADKKKKEEDAIALNGEPGIQPPEGAITTDDNPQPGGRYVSKCYNANDDHSSNGVHWQDLMWRNNAVYVAYTGEDAYKSCPASMLNNDVFTCKGYCYWSHLNSCDTSHCYCGLLSCPGGNIDLYNAFDNKDFGDGSDGEYESDGTGYGETLDSDNIDVTEDHVKTALASMTTKSAYKIPIERIYGHNYMPGNLIWMSETRQEEFTDTNVSFDKSTSEVKYTSSYNIKTFIDFSFGVAAGEVDGLITTYLENVNVLDNPGLNVTWYKGSESQGVNEEQAKQEGFGRTPAYRGLAYVTLGNLDISHLKSFPEVRIEVATKAESGNIQEDSPTIAGLDTTDIFAVDAQSGRVITETSAGVGVFDYNDLSNIFDAPVSNAIEVTPSGRLITYDGTNVGVYEHPAGEVGSYLANNTISESFLMRIVDMSGNNFLGLISENSSGDGFIEEIDEVTLEFPDDAVGNQDLTGLDTAPHSHAVSLGVARGVDVKPTEFSIFLLRKDTDVTDLVKIVELRMISFDADAKVLESGEWYTHTIDTTVFGSPSDLIVRGVVPIEVDDTLLIMVSYTGVNRLVKWHTESGVIWTVDVDELPSFGKYSPMREGEAGIFRYITSSGNIYTINLRSGANTVENNGNTGLAGNQSYDHVENNIIYHGAGGILTRLSLNNLNPVELPLRTFFQQVVTLSGLKKYDIDADDLIDVSVKGYRSGSNNLTARDMILQLSTVYSTVLFESERLIAKEKKNLVASSIDPYHFKTKPDKNVSGRHDNRYKQVTTTYFSDDADGLPTTQSFSFDDTKGTIDAHQFTVLESDDFMKSLAELLSYLSKIAPGDQIITIPPMYLAITPGDVSVTDISRLTNKVSIGANNEMALELSSESSHAYTAMVPMTGTANSSVPFNNADKGSVVSVAPPVGITARGVEDTLQPHSYVYYGVSNLLGTFKAGIGVSEHPFGPPFYPKHPLAMGRLSVLPQVLGTSRFVTFPDDSLEIVFPDVETVARILALPFRAGECPDYRVMDGSNNLLIVGKELIQFAYAEAGLTANSVKFVNLLRGMQGSNGETDTHSINEAAMLVEEGVTTKVQLRDEKSTLLPFLVTSFDTDSRSEPFSIGADPSSLYPNKTAIITKADIVSYEASYTYPDNPDIDIFFNPSVVGMTGFLNDRTDLLFYESGLRDTINEVFILRAAYNETLFDIERDGNGFTYIVYRGIIQPIGSDDNAIYKTTFSHHDMNGGLTALYDAASEPLVVVVVSTNDYKEYRHITTWLPNDIDYSGVAQRGMN